MQDISKGLSYLHDSGVVHGDLHGVGVFCIPHVPTAHRLIIHYSRKMYLLQIPSRLLLPILGTACAMVKRKNRRSHAYQPCKATVRPNCEVPNRSGPAERVMSLRVQAHLWSFYLADRLMPSLIANLCIPRVIEPSLMGNGQRWIASFRICGVKCPWNDRRYRTFRRKSRRSTSPLSGPRKLVCGSRSIRSPDDSSLWVSCYFHRSKTQLIGQILSILGSWRFWHGSQVSVP